MKAKTFEDYLKNIHSEGYMGTDDDMPDAFEKWLEQFDVANILELVAKYENDRNIAAQHLGSIKTKKKAKSSRMNGINPLQPHMEKVKHFIDLYPYSLESNEWKVKFPLGVKTKRGFESTYNPDFFCPTTGFYIEVATSLPNKSEQGWKWTKVLKDGQKLKIYWWEGNEITGEFS